MTWGFPNIRGTILGVPIIKTIIFLGLYWGPLILENYHMSREISNYNLPCHHRQHLFHHQHHDVHLQSTAIVQHRSRTGDGSGGDSARRVIIGRDLRLVYVAVRMVVTVRSTHTS